MIEQVTTWAAVATALLTGLGALFAALGYLLRQAVKTLDWMDNRWPALLPYTEWITDPSRRRPRGVPEGEE